MSSRPSLPPLGEFIRSQREFMSLSMRQLAETANVSNPYLSQIERGLYKPSAQVLKGIADALDISVETLFQRAGLLDDADDRAANGVEHAIRMDRRLTKEGKQALIQAYRGLVGTPEADVERRPAPPRPRALKRTGGASRAKPGRR
jgi:transcriptional regulator with XRE-family HTH domain